MKYSHYYIEIILTLILCRSLYIAILVRYNSDIDDFDVYQLDFILL